MKQMLNTLYINRDGAYIGRDGECLDIRCEGESISKFPVRLFESVVCFGRVTLSSGAMDLCADNNVAVSFMTVYGRFIARLEAPVRGNVLLRRQQYRWADSDDQAAAVARAMISAKVANSRAVLQRAARDQKDQKTFAPAVADMAACLRSLQQGGQTLDELRGIEGESAAAYFGCFDAMILSDKTHFFFRGRNRRPPTDCVNALLSLGYSLLTSSVTSALEAVGLDPCVGFLHRDRPGRPGLALDLMEELRAYLVDRFVLSLINLRRVKSDDFVFRENGAVSLTDNARKDVFLKDWHERRQEEITHPYLNEKIPLGLLPFAQASLLARAIRGDIDGYPPFFLR